MSVDLKVIHKNGCVYWLDAKLADDGDLAAIVATATRDLKKYRDAAKQANEWALDSHLSDRVMLPPSGFGTLVCSSGELLLCVDGFDNHQATWDSWLRPSRQRNLVERKATKKASRTRVLRKRGCQVLHKETRLGAAPALKRPATERLTASRVGRACWHAYGSDVTSMLQLLAACYTTAFDMTAICLYGITIIWQKWAQAVPQTNEQPTNQPTKQTNK